jgi:hypothetical protein
MRTVFSSQSEVAHRWANQTQDHARSGPMSFNGVYAYSYDTAIGRLHTVNGHTVAVMSDVYYSSTTCKHKSQFARALSHITTLWVKCGIDSVEEALLEFQDGALDYLMRNATSALNPDFNHALFNIEWFNKLVHKLGYKHLELIVDKELIKLGKEYQRFRDRRNKQLDANREERQRVEQEKLAKERQAKIDEELPTWLKGGMRNSVLSSMEPSFIRINENRVETTGGASVGLREAKLLMDAILAGKKVKGTEINGYPVIGFDRKQGTVKIGCHNISFDQAVKVLKGANNE